ncbi:MAG: tyrosine-type recombinase/integrase [Verrucomicrobiia bacterium]
MVMDAIVKLKKGETQVRWARAILDPALDHIKDIRLLETRSDHFLRVLENGTVSTNVFLRRLHNFALDMTWLAWPILPKRQWPAVTHADKRAVTLEEHQALIAVERNPERRAFYQLCWYLGGSQGDVASLTAEDIDWQQNAIGYARKKTGEISLAHFGDEVAAILSQLPARGPLFPNLQPMRASDRATEFKRLCRRANIEGVTLHSYRYSWAERARTCGMPERFAQEALGHNSKAVARFYAKRAKVNIPSLEDYEKAKRKIVRGEFQQLPREPGSAWARARPWCSWSYPRAPGRGRSPEPGAAAPESE